MAKPFKYIENLTISTVTHEGKGMGREEGKVIFVDYALPGDKVRVRISKSKKDYAIGTINKLIEPSLDRVEPSCGHFGLCGGCKWQHADYNKQLEYKEKIVKESFERIGKISFLENLKIKGNKEIFYYRNKLEYTFSAKRWLTTEEIESGEEIERRALGFHIPGQFGKVINIDNCFLQDNRSNLIRNELREFALIENLSFYNIQEHEGLLRNIIIRNTTLDEWMVIVSFGGRNMDEIKLVMEFLKNKYRFITSLYYVINLKMNDTIFDLPLVLYNGKPSITEQLGHCLFEISPKSFFQTNSIQAKELYDVALNFANIKPNDLVYDLYTGTGSIACYIAHLCKKVVGIEYIPEAINDAKKNAALNKIENATFYSGEVEKILDNAFIDQNGRPDIIITDPPRSGMHKDVIEKILEISPQKIVYISCNPATQARDVQLLSEKYVPVKSQPLDLFPHTYHIENVALLIRKEDK
jgi:23S rRNA (uracil1939-C5)-methyltransferase